MNTMVYRSISPVVLCGSLFEQSFVVFHRAEPPEKYT